MDETITIGVRLDEARVLLQSAEAGTPAFESLGDLAARKLPEVEAHIARVHAVRDWLIAATECTCTTLDVCALCDPRGTRHL
jgi:hypothetical protein